MAALTAERWGPERAARLVVLCHGVGASGEDLIGLAPMLAGSLPGTAFAAPDAPEPYDGGGGRQWWPIGNHEPARMAAGAAAAQAGLDGFIDAELARLGLPAGAYALAGFSQGAMMVLFAGLRRAVPPAHILAFSGALVAPERLGDRANSAPVLLVHGLADPVVPAARSREAEALLRAAGVPVEARYVPGLGHAVDPSGIAAAAAALRGSFGM